MTSRLGRLQEDCWTNLQTGNTKWSEYEKDTLHNITTQMAELLWEENWQTFTGTEKKSQMRRWYDSNEEPPAIVKQSDIMKAVWRRKTIKYVLNVELKLKLKLIFWSTTKKSIRNNQQNKPNRNGWYQVDTFQWLNRFAKPGSNIIFLLSNLPEMKEIFLSSRNFQSDLAACYAQLMRESWDSSLTSAFPHLLSA